MKEQEFKTRFFGFEFVLLTTLNSVNHVLLTVDLWYSADADGGSII